MHYSTRLRWIKPGLDEQLGVLRQILSEFTEEELRDHALDEVKQSLARIRSTLELVSVYGAALLVEEMGALAVALAKGRVEHQDDGLRLLIQGVLQLPHYLERVQRSGQDIPILLMPLLNDIRALLRRRLLSETSLFSPDLSTVVPELPSSAVAQGAITSEGVRPYAKRLRTFYQKGLVDWFRGEESSGLNTLGAVLRYLEKLSGNSPLGTLWWIASGAVAALRDGSLPGGVSIKLLMGQLDLQVRELAEAGGEYLDRAPPPELLKNLLFYIGRFRSGQHRARRIIALYRLDELLPEDDTDGFLGPGLEVMDSVTDALSDDLTRVKDVMDIYVRSESASPEHLRPALGVLSRVADTLALLGLGGARQTVLNQSARLAAYLESGDSPDNDVLLSIAGALLEVDSALSALASRGFDEALRDDEGAAEVKALKDHDQEQIVAAAIAEIRVELVGIKEASEAYLGAPQATHHLERIREHFSRVVGGLTLLEFEPLAELMGECARYVEERLRANAPRLPPESGLEAYAEAVMSTDYFLEGYLEGRVDTDEIISRIRDSVAALELPPDVEVDEEWDFDDDKEEVELAPPPEEHDEAAGLAAPQVDQELSVGDDSDEITLASKPGEEWTETGTPTMAEPGAQPGDPDFNGDGEVAGEMPEHLSASLADARERLRRLDDDYGGSVARETAAAGAAEEAAFPGTDDPSVVAAQPAESAPVDEAPGPDQAAQDAADPEIVEIFLEEVEETLRVIDEQIHLWREDPQRAEPLSTIRRGFHTLKGSGRLVGAVHLGELAWAMERMLNRLLEGTLAYRAAIPDLLVDVHRHMPEMVVAFRDGAEPSSQYRDFIRRADALADGPPPGLDGGGSGQGGEGGSDRGGEEPGGDSEMPSPSAGAKPERDAGTPGEARSTVDAGMLQVFLPEAEGVLEGLREACSQLTLAGGGLVDESLVRHCHTLRGITRLAGFEDHSALYGFLESAFDLHRVGRKPVSIDICALLQESVDVLDRTLDALRSGRRPDPLEPGLLERAKAFAESPVSPRESVADAGEEDELAAELREVFVEEAGEIQHSCDQVLERWRGTAVDRQALAELQRLLHTLKGGARMAELSPMVSLSHSMETLLTRLTEGRVVPSQAIRDAVQHGLDGVAHMLDEVRAGRPLKEATDVVTLIERVETAHTGATAKVESEAATTDRDSATEVREPEGATYEVAVLEDPPVVSLVTDPPRDRGDRDGMSAGLEKVAVGVDTLDQMVSTSGEISIARSQIEQQVGELGSTIKEMDQTVNRLRSQLRRLDIETESQILFRHERAEHDQQDDRFDPLELDRFTEVQELSRGLLESVSDLASIQGQLTELVRNSETFLLQQARLSSDLQERLLTSRMVSFARYIPRLRRLARQTAKELNKQVEMNVRGQEEELDHTIIGPVVGALGHLLNNAVDHGIESPEVRRGKGKPATGRIELVVERDHSDVIIRLADDGTGMDLEAIRRQAIARQLLDEQVEVTDDELVQFVFEQAFSTADEVTRISGRGVGLDVVNAAINQLSGSLTVDTAAGKGTSFTIRLPTTISMSQALMVHVEEEQFGFPLSHLEGVMQMAHQQVDALFGEPTPSISYLDEEYRVFHLGRILGIGGKFGVTLQRRVPILFVRVADRRMAFVVDNLGGRQEIVVKPVGPQLGTISWILGATVLGDGRVVLVIDLPALVRVAATQPEPVSAKRKLTAAEQDAGRPPLVMVVDDSLTVRRVAERFLERNGMEVLTARDGVEALALLQDHAPDVMLLDIEMPRMDGYELATSIRNDERLRNLPIIMITSRSGQKHSERARSIGVDHYMSKPYQEAELLDRIYALTAVGHA